MGEIGIQVCPKNPLKPKKKIETRNPKKKISLEKLLRILLETEKK